MLGLAKTTKYRAEFSADQWELYTSSMDCREVADKLNRMLTELLNGNIPRHEVEKNMLVYMDRFAEYGAADSEPMRLLERVLEEAFD